MLKFVIKLLGKIPKKRTKKKLKKIDKEIINTNKLTLTLNTSGLNVPMKRHNGIKKTTDTTEIRKVVIRIYMYPNVCSSTIHNSQGLEAI